VIRPELGNADIAELGLEVRTKLPSVLQPITSLDAIGSRERKLIEKLNIWRVRAGVAYWHLRSALRAIRKPFLKLTDFDR
jgi:hypothetical protein